MIVTQPGAQPTLSRVADSLYWMSRYLERAEHTARLLDVNLDQMLDEGPDDDGQRWHRLNTSLYLTTPIVTRDGYALARELTFNQSNRASIIYSIGAARENARQVREQISSEMWQHLNQLYLEVKRASKNRAWRTQPRKFFLSVKEGSYLFQGSTDSTMNQGEGWRFIQVGRSLERAGAVAAVLDAHFREREKLTYLDWVGLLRSCTAFEAYCKIYKANIKPHCIVEFLLLNSQFPHAISFAVNRMQIELEAIAQSTGIRSNNVVRLTGRLRAALDYGVVDEIMEDMHSYLLNIRQQCTAIHQAIIETYVDYAADRFLEP